MYLHSSSVILDKSLQLKNFPYIREEGETETCFHGNRIGKWAMASHSERGKEGRPSGSRSLPLPLGGVALPLRQATKESFSFTILCLHGSPWLPYPA